MTAETRDSKAARTQRYSAVAILLHWLTVAAIVLQLVLAWRMHGPNSPETFATFQLHKSVGITILALTLIRIAWRLANRPPPEPATLAGWERFLARITHAGFYVLLIVMPLTGWLAVSTSRLRVPTLLYGVIPWPDLPGLARLSAEARKSWHEAGETGHSLLALLLLALLALHVAGALKHQFLDRNTPVLGRMLPGARAGRWLEPRLIAVVIVLLAVGAFGVTAKLAAPQAAVPPAAAPAEPPAAETAAPAPTVAAPAPPAAAAAPPAAAAVVAEPVKWKVLPGSNLKFATTWGGQAIQGRFAQWNADILFSPDALDRSRVKVDIDIASADTGDAQRDSSLHGEDWFDAAAHPKATFTAERFEKTGPDRYVAHGKLALRGVSQSQDLPFRLKIDGDTAHVTGVTSLDRTAFGVGQGEWKSTDQIPGKVTVSLDVKARRN